jgi:hypothetical protein
MNRFVPNLLRFLAAFAFVACVHYVYYGQATPESETSTPRVRFLDIPIEHKYDSDALAEIYIEGDIDAEIIDEFNETIKRHSLKHARVLFSSNGGNIDTGIELGWNIRNLGFTTDVGSYSGTWNDSYAAGCFSACTMAYLGGQYRFFHPKSEFGVHQYKSEHAMGLYTFADIEVYAQAFSGYMLDFVTEMGVDPEFYEMTVAQDNADIEYIGYEDLIRLKVVNNGAQDPEWETSIVESRPVLRGSQKRLGQSGELIIKCEKGPVIKFINDRKKYTLDNAPRSLFELIIDKQIVDVTKQISSEDIAVRDAQLIVHFRPTPAQRISMLGSEDFGIRFIDQNKTRFTQTISLKGHRKMFADYINWCAAQ